MPGLRGLASPTRWQQYGSCVGGDITEKDTPGVGQATLQLGEQLELCAANEVVMYHVSRVMALRDREEKRYLCIG